MALQEFKNKIAARLKELRTARGYTEKYLAQQLNVTVRTYRTWETGKALTNINNFCHLARKVYKITLKEFFAPCR